MAFKIKTQGGKPGQLDFKTREFLDILPKGKTEMAGVSPDDLRGPSATFLFNLPAAAVYTEEISIAVRDGYEVLVRIYRKDKNTLAAPLVYFHGGCWVFCNLDSHDSVCRQLCLDSGMTVFSVDYRLAPENKFPTGLQDAYDAALYISQNYETLKVTADALVVAGDSAGGNLATVLARMAKDSQEFKVRGQLLYYPVTDASNMESASYNSFAVDHFLTKGMMQWGAQHYAREAADYLDPLVSPLLSDNLVGLPKTLIQTAEFDVLRDEAEAYAAKLAGAGVDVECVRYNGMIHGYVGLAGKIHLAKKAIDDSVEFLKTIG